MDAMFYLDNNTIAEVIVLYWITIQYNDFCSRNVVEVVVYLMSTLSPLQVEEII